MNQREYQICTNCVMGTTDFKITFYDKGVYDHCRDFYENVLPIGTHFLLRFFSLFHGLRKVFTTCFLTFVCNHRVEFDE